MISYCFTKHFKSILAGVAFFVSLNRKSVKLSLKCIHGINKRLCWNFKTIVFQILVLFRASFLWKHHEYFEQQFHVLTHFSIHLNIPLCKKYFLNHVGSCSWLNVSFTDLTVNEHTYKKAFTDNSRLKIITQRVLPVQPQKHNISIQVFHTYQILCQYKNKNISV